LRVLAAGTADSEPLLYDVTDGAISVLQPLSSAAQALHGATDPAGVSQTVAVAEASNAELFDLLSATTEEVHDGGATDAFVASTPFAWYTAGASILLLRPPSMPLLFDLTTLEPALSLRAVAASENRAFGAGTHVCTLTITDPPACGPPQSPPWVDVWAFTPADLAGITADGRVLLTGPTGVSSAAATVLPSAATGPVTLRKVQGVGGASGPAGRRLWVAGEIGANPEAYFARLAIANDAVTVTECALPGVVTVADMWVRKDESEIYFVSGGGLHRLTPELP